MRSPAQIHQTNDPLPIVILGGGFAGLFTALHLRDLDSCPIILIDQSWNFDRLIAHNIKVLIASKSPTPASVNLRGTLMKLGLHQSAVEIFDRYEIKGQLRQAIA